MDQWHWGFTSFAGPKGPAPIYYSLFTRNQGTSLEPCPICAPLPGASPATIHFSLFTLTFFAHKAITCGLVQNSAPSSSSPRRRRGAPRGGGEEEALVQTKMDPCFDKMSLYKVAIVCKFGTNLTCFSVPDRCRWPGAHRALQGSRAHQASGSGKRSRGHASLRQTAPGLPLCKKASYRSTVLAKFAPQPSSSPPPCTALLFFSAWRRRGGGCISDKTASQCLVAEKGKSE